MKSWLYFSLAVVVAVVVLNSLPAGNSTAKKADQATTTEQDMGDCQLEEVILDNGLSGGLVCTNPEHEHAVTAKSLEFGEELESAHEHNPPDDWRKCDFCRRRDEAIQERRLAAAGENDDLR